MPRGRHKSKSPRVCQQKKARKARRKPVKTLAGSLLPYLKSLDDGQGTSTDAAHQSPINKDDSSDARRHPAEEPLVEVAEFEGEEQGVEDFEAEEGAESESSNDTVNETSDIKEKELQILSDVSFWEIPVPGHLQIAIIKQGSVSFQNKDGPFSVTAQHGACQLSKEWFYVMTTFGMRILRPWMVYSPVSKKVYCFCCRLFAVSATDAASKFVTGFQIWWELSPEIHPHNNSDEHICCFEKWKTLEGELRLHKTIDAKTINGNTLTERGKKEWRDILHRFIDVIFLTKQNLASSDHTDNESLSCDRKDDEASFNIGGFPAKVELLSDYDPVLKELLMRLKCTRELVSETEKSFISTLASHVKKRLVADIKSAKCFGIMFDITPDVTNTDQMSEVIRYVKINNGEVEVKEVFLGCFPSEGKSAAELSSDILKNLESNGLDIMACCAQSYNDAIMARIREGVQSILKEKNRKAIFNGCVDHSLNHCAWQSFSENALCLSCFGTLQATFSFFAASPNRWDVLIRHTGVSVERSSTHWSSHLAAVQPVKEKFDEFVAAIEALCDTNQSLATRSGALYVWHLVDFAFLCFLYFWCDVLQEVDLAEQYLQNNSLTLGPVVTKLEALRLFLHEEGERLVENAIDQALLKLDKYGIEIESRVVFRKRVAGERVRNAKLSPQEEIKRGMRECIECFRAELQIKSAAIKEVASMFEAVQVETLISATEEELKVSVPKLTSFYDEVDESALLLEIPRLKRHLIVAKIDLEKAKQDWTTLDVLRFIVEWCCEDSFPDLVLSLRLFLTICAPAASCERGFSKPQLVKSYLRSAVEQLNPSDFAILAIENEFVKGIDFEEVIDKFVALKAEEEEEVEEEEQEEEEEWWY